MAKEFKKGDRVEWNSHGGKAVGTVQAKITSDSEAGSRKVKASKEEPQWMAWTHSPAGAACARLGRAAPGRTLRELAPGTRG